MLEVAFGDSTHIRKMVAPLTQVCHEVCPIQMPVALAKVVAPIGRRISGAASRYMIKTACSLGV